MTGKSTDNKPGKQGILSDHKRNRKKLIAPFNHMLGGLKDTSYIDLIMPEIVWIALLHHGCGMSEGVELARALSKAAIESVVREKKVFFGHVSAYADLVEEERKTVISKLEVAGVLERLQRILLPLVAFYPECPLSFLLPDGVPELRHREYELSEFKQVLGEMYDKTSSPAVFALATFMYLGFLGDAVKVSEDLSLAKFPEIEKYPSTDLSKQIASGIRAFAISFFGIVADQNPSPWPIYFWNRGLKLGKCNFGEEDD